MPLISTLASYLWKIPLGNYPELAAKGMKDTGSENYGGPIVTAGGLVFIGATVYDKTSALSTLKPASCCGRDSFRFGNRDSCNLHD